MSLGLLQKKFVWQENTGKSMHEFDITVDMSVSGTWTLLFVSSSGVGPS